MFLRSGCLRMLSVHGKSRGIAVLDSELRDVLRLLGLALYISHCKRKETLVVLERFETVCGAIPDEDVGMSGSLTVAGVPNRGRTISGVLNTALSRSLDAGDLL